MSITITFSHSHAAYATLAAMARIAPKLGAAFESFEGFSLELRAARRAAPPAAAARGGARAPIAAVVGAPPEDFQNSALLDGDPLERVPLLSRVAQLLERGEHVPSLQHLPEGDVRPVERAPGGRWGT